MDDALIRRELNLIWPAWPPREHARMTAAHLTVVLLKRLNNWLGSRAVEAFYYSALVVSSLEVTPCHKHVQPISKWI